MVSTLDPLKVELVKEITGDDAYLPGGLWDLMIISDTAMLVSDTGTNTIEQFTTDGEHVATIAEAGRGPGELSNLFSMYKGAGDTDEKGKQLVVLSRNGEPLGKVELAFEDEIKAVKDNRIYTLHTNPKTGHRIRIYHVEI